MNFKNRISSAVVFLLAVLMALPLTVSASEPPEPANAEYVYLYNIDNDKLLYSKNADAELSSAPIARIMTALIAIEKFGDDLSYEVTVSGDALKRLSGFTAGLKEGERISVYHLLCTLIVSCSVDSANALAIEIAGSIPDFTDMMNARAKELGADSTVFTDPSGKYSEEAVTNLNDIAKIVLAAYKTNTYIEISRIKKHSVPATNLSSARAMSNRNFFVSTTVQPKYYFSAVNGMAYAIAPDGTDCVIATADKNGFATLCIVMNVPRGKDEDGSELMYAYPEAKELINWASSAYDYITVIDTARAICEIPVSLSARVDHVVLLPERSVDVYLPADIDVEKEIEQSYELYNESLVAPVEGGEKAGVLYLRYRGEVIAEIPLVTRNSVEKSSFLQITTGIVNFIKTPGFIITVVIIVLAAIAGVFVTAAYRYRRAVRRRYRNSTK